MSNQSAKPRFTVIVPVYNCRQYLEECLDSVRTQNLVDIEIILVDDGSTDGSASLMHTLAAGDERIVVLALDHNQGVSVARNLALDNARGEYICFLDADDYWSDRNMLAELYRQAFADQADILRFGINKLGANGEVLFTSVDRQSTRINLATRYDWKFSYTTVTHVIRRELIEQYQLRFEPGLSMGEDALFNIGMYCHARRLSVSNKVYYDYRYTQDSANNTAWVPDKLFCTVRWFELAIDVIKQSPVYAHRPDLLQDLCKERLQNLMRRLGRLALDILNEDQLREFVARWANCLAETKTDGMSEVEQRFLGIVTRSDAATFREYFESGAEQNAQVTLSREQARQLGQVLLSQQDNTVNVALGGGWKLSLPKDKAHSLARKLLNLKDEKFILKL